MSYQIKDWVNNCITLERDLVSANGEWNGFFVQSGRQYRLDLQLLFLPSGNVMGTGHMGAHFSELDGAWQGNNAISFVQTGPGGRPFYYSGQISNNYQQIKGYVNNEYFELNRRPR